MDKAAQRVGDEAKVVKINVDDNQPLAPRFGVTGIPALLVFKNGRVVEQLRSGSDLAQRLLAHAN